MSALQPEDNQAAYPVGIFKELLNEEVLQAKPMEQLNRQFPAPLGNIWQIILKNTVFSRVQQAKLCRLAVRAYKQENKLELVHEFINTLGSERYSAVFRGEMLTLLLSFPSIRTVTDFWKTCQTLLNFVPNDPSLKEHWLKTCEIWLKGLKKPKMIELFTQINNQTVEKRALLLHISAFSSLQQGLLSDDDYQVRLEKRFPKLVTRLLNWPVYNLTLLAGCYPKVPHPNTDDVLRLDKLVNRNQFDLKTALTEFHKNPYTSLRADYAVLSATRDIDFQRMLQETQHVSGDHKRPLNLREMSRLSLMFAYLKQLESGEIKVRGWRIKSMSEEELLEAFNDYSRSDLTDQETITLWAILFEGVKRKSKKYPHLAQQYALISMDISLLSGSKVLVLGTGEGKSHFIALRAVKYLATGKKIHIHTGKDTLAQRDQQDYEWLFDYFGLKIKSTHLEVKSPFDTLDKYNVIYTQIGNLSLHLEHHAYHGHLIKIDRENCVGLFDEFDFIRFDQGIKTQYIFSITAGKTPEQMRWLYQGINSFYVKNKSKFNQQKVFDEKTLIKLVHFLSKTAGEDQGKCSDIQYLINHPLELVRWLQSAYEADKLTRSVDFSLLEENIVVGEESYPMREIIPLSTDNQKMIGATFSEGVQQLLAERLNEEERKNNRPPNIHLPPMSQIISAQVAAVCMRDFYAIWEGFTGSFSDLQAEKIYEETSTEVLYAPTNQRCLRDWRPPEFFDNETQRMDRLVQEISRCLREKKSFLFACKNDKSVEELKAKLSERLDESQLNQLIFFTNEDLSTNTQLLAQKKGMEQWRHNQKQKGVGLMASGFGRGDNLDVDEVFLFDVIDNNDRLQKGGRDARNGAEGKVWEFYLWKDVEEEHKRLLNLALQYDTGIKKKLDKINTEHKITDYKTLTHRQLLYLREWFFYKENKVNENYHNLLAEYHGWARPIFARLSQQKNIEGRLYFKSIWSEELKRIEQEWLNISSNEQLSAEEKINKIRQGISIYSQTFFENCQRIHGWQQLNVSAFKWRPNDHIQKSPKKPIISDDEKKSALAIAHVLLHFSVPNDNKRWDKLLENLELLQKIDQKKYTHFAEQATQYHSFTAFEEALTILIENSSPTPYTYEKIEQMLEKNQLSRIKGNLDPIFWQYFCEKAVELIPMLRDKLVEKIIQTPMLMHYTTCVCAVIDFLARFSKEQQQDWGTDYVDHLLHIVKATSANEVTARFSPPPIPFFHHQALSQLAKSYAADERTQIALFTLLAQTVSQGNSETRLRWLSRCEVLLQNSDPSHLASAFLTDVCQVMQSFDDPNTSVQFNQLLNNTEASWGSYQKEWRLFWQQLAKHCRQLPQTLDYLSDIQLPGKLTCVWPNQYLQLDSQTLKMHWPLLLEWMKMLLSLKLKKSQNTQLFAQVVESLRENPSGVFNSKERVVEKVESFSKLIKNHPDRLAAGQLVKLLRYQVPLNEGSQIYQQEYCVFIVNKIAVHPSTAKWTSAQLDGYLTELNKAISISANPKEMIDYFLKADEKLLGWSDYTQAMQVMAWLVKYPRSASLLSDPKQFRSFKQLLQGYEKLFRLYPKLDEQLVNYLFAQKPDDVAALRLFHCEILCILLKQNSAISIKDFFSQIKGTDVFSSVDMRSLMISACKQWPNQASRLFADFSKLAGPLDPNLFNDIIDQLLQLYQQLDNLLLSSKKAKEITDKFLNLPLLYQQIDLSGLSPGDPYKFGNELRWQFLHLIKKYQEVCKENPAAVNNLIDCFAKKHGLLRAEMICQVLSKKNHSLKLANINQLVQGVKDKNIKKMHEWVTKHSDYAVSLLTDHWVNYCPEELPLYLGSVAILFYQLLDHYYPHIDNIMADSRVKALFDFTSTDPVCHEKRCFWMKLLSHRVFISSIWELEKNDVLLQAGFAHYNHRAEQILNEEKVNLTGDLTEKQHGALLQLSQELANIDNPKDKSIKLQDRAAHVQALQEKIAPVIGEYTSIWKSATRKAQLETFQADLQQTITAQTDKNSRYQQVLIAIFVARNIAIEADEKANKTSWFKQNRKGYSRYLDMLDQLTHMVVKHWVTDLSAIGAFHLYRNDFIDMFNQSLLMLLSAFSDDERKKFSMLNKILVGLKFSKKDKEMQKIKLTALNVQLRHDLPRLPGHLATLARMTLAQGEALAVPHQDPFEEKMCQLLTHIHERIDRYDAAWGKSSDRQTALDKLKNELSQAMLDASRHDRLIEVLQNSKKEVITKDKEKNQDPNTWFKVNLKGHSRYLTLLTELERLVMRHYVASDELVQLGRVDKDDLIKSFNNIHQYLSEELDSLDDHYNQHKGSMRFFCRTALSDVQKLKVLLEQPNLTNKLSELDQLLEKIRTTTTLPGHVATLAKQLLEVGEQLRLHIKPVVI